MRGLRRQAQHGPTCRSIVILVLGISVISITTRPSVLRGHLRLAKLGRNDDLRQERERPFRRSQQAVKPKVAEKLESEEEEPEALANAEAGEAEAQDAKGSGGTGLDANAIHVALTSNGSPYLNWQSRIMYYTYLKVAKQPGSDMKYFTRILHRMTPDALMDVIPTYRVDPLDPSCDTWCEYPVASRPAAIQTWLNSGDVKAEWVFMIETDYVFVRPASIPASGRPLGFPFGYVDPNHPNSRECTRKYSKGVPTEKVQGTGNAPTLITVEDLKKIMPYWVGATALIEKDSVCKEVFGWVREMYSFSISAAVNGVHMDLPPVPDAIMSQPPADRVIGKAVVLHYTWGSFFKKFVNGKEETYWKFEKREFTNRGLPDRFPDLPSTASEAQIALMGAINEAIDNLPKYTRRELQEEGKSEAEIQQYFEEYKARMARLGRKGGEEVLEGSEAASGGKEEEDGGKEHGDADGGGGEKEDEVKDGGEAAGGTQSANIEPNTIHTILTSNGNPYMNWQTQIMYNTYLKVAAMPGSDLQFFTRILHRTKDDELSASIPTFLAKSLHPECDGWCEYPVADRPDAVLQWLKAGQVRGDWIFMVESDYVFVKPVSIPASGRALGFEYGYIIPTWPTIHHIMVRYYPGDLKDVPQTGNAPMLGRTEDMMRVVPHWVDITARFEKDPAAKKELGWVREMYAFSIAAALGKMLVDLPRVPKSIMVQPPADEVLGTAAIIHYTWGMEIKEGDKVIWRFDKRDYTSPGQHPPLLAELPAGKGSELQKLFVERMNEAIREEFYDKLHRR